MNKKEIFRKIGGIISELTEQYQYLSQNLDNLDNLELELFAANSTFLTDHVEILKKLNAAGPSLSQQPAVSRPVQEESIPVSGAEPKSAPEKQDEQFDFEKYPQSPEKLYGRKLTEEEQAVIGRKTAEPPPHTQGLQPPVSAAAPDLTPAEEKAEVKEVVIPEKTVSVETPRKEPEPEKAAVPTVNDLISAQLNTGSTAPGVSRQPVSDLKSIISLNDKLLFIKELFNGYSLAYSEAIEILNRFESFEAAENFLNTNYAGKNQWASKSATVGKFYELLRRRYAK